LAEEDHEDQQGEENTSDHDNNMETKVMAPAASKDDKDATNSTLKRIKTTSRVVTGENKVHTLYIQSFLHYYFVRKFLLLHAVRFHM
jgi:hypothetical protein